MANAYVLNPAIAKDLRSLTTGDGTNSAKNWLPAPPDIAEMQQLVSNQVAVGNSVFGDFTTIMLGLRQDIRIEVSNSANNSFEKNMVMIRATWRGDWNFEHSEHLVRLIGITS